MNLKTQLRDYIRSCCAGMWISSFEQDEAVSEIAELCREEDWALGVWDIDQGLHLVAGSLDSEIAAHDPLSAVRAAGRFASQGRAGVLVLKNLHRYLGSAEIVQALIRQIVVGRQQRSFIIVLAPVIQMPIELERLFVVLEHELPSREQLEVILRDLATEADELPEPAELSPTLDAAMGLTRWEAENAFSLSLVREGRVTPRSIWELKTQSLKKSGLLNLHRGSESFDSLGGLTALKRFCQRALERRASAVSARGVMLLSPPGCGKSQFAKSLGSESGRPTLILDVGALMGSLVGQTESNIRLALKIVDALSPCVVMIDEIDKALSGVSGSVTDSGVSSRLFGTLLSWLNDHQSDAFVVATCNDIGRLPPEFARAERFDGIFFVDLPGAVQKADIWRIWLEAFSLDPDQPKPRTELWTGAEIRACCRLAALLDLSLVEAAKNVVPVAVTAAESVERLRSWASGRCLDADSGGIYTRSSASPTGSRRAVRTDPQNN